MFGTWSLDLNGLTDNWASTGLGTHRFEFGGCFGCVTETLGVSRSFPWSGPWSTPPIMPTATLSLERYEQVGWRWPS